MDFDQQKITDAIWKAVQAVGGTDKKKQIMFQIRQLKFYIHDSMIQTLLMWRIFKIVLKKHL